MKRIGFYQPHLDIQGTGVSYFDYAFYNEKILGNKSIMFCDRGDHRTHPLAEQKFKENLEVVELDGRENMSLLSSKCKEMNVDALYIQKCGRHDDGRFVYSVPTFIHVVGVQRDPHGTVYAYVSKWLSEHCSNSELPFVPYIIDLPSIEESFREQLKIPNDAVVFGRIGGPYGWNIPFVNEVIDQILKQRSNYYFLFANTDRFTSHERVLFVESFADLRTKRRFINTCDAMIHARNEGESFGAAVGEFSFCNKPVITFKGSPERNHIITLGDKGIYYNNKEDLHGVLHNFAPDTKKDWNAYKEFTPQAVMQQFNNVFIAKL
jgi:hypothetical protein